MVTADRPYRTDGQKPNFLKHRQLTSTVNAHHLGRYRHSKTDAYPLTHCLQYPLPRDDWIPSLLHCHRVPALAPHHLSNPFPPIHHCPARLVSRPTPQSIEPLLHQRAQPLIVHGPQVHVLDQGSRFRVLEAHRFRGRELRLRSLGPKRGFTRLGSGLQRLHPFTQVVFQQVMGAAYAYQGCALAKRRRARPVPSGPSQGEDCRLANAPRPRRWTNCPVFCAT
jgi:hypothetical protein